MDNRSEEAPVSQRVTVAKASEIPEGGSVVVSVRQKDVAIFRINGVFQAIDDMCPHMGASLSGGFVEDGCVTCPWHYWRFRVAPRARGGHPQGEGGAYPGPPRGGGRPVGIAGAPSPGG